ncbi:hypothetical protein CSUI_006705, partial [Cystoisospora suis]
RRGRGRRGDCCDEEESVYIRNSKQPVSYSLLDLISQTHPNTHSSSTSSPNTNSKGG